MPQLVMQEVIQDLIFQGKMTDPESARGRLLKAAAKLFRQKGFGRTTVRDIASEVGILSGSIFHHFSNKDEILYTVMKESVLYITAYLQKAVAVEAEIPDKIRILIRSELEFVHSTDIDAIAVLIHEWRYLSKEKQKLILAMRETYEALWVTIFENALRDGYVSVEPALLRHILYGSIIWSRYWYRPGGDLTLDQLSDRILSLALTKMA